MSAEGAPPDRTVTARLIAWYCLAIGSVGAFHPFLAVVLDRRGATGTQLALSLALFPLGLLFAGPLWGRIADASSRPQRVMAIALSIAALGAIATLFGGPWWAILPGVALMATSRSPGVSLGDVLTVRLLGGGRAGEQAYGGVRVWGSVTFIAMVFGVGALTDRWADAPLFANAALLVGLAALSWRLPAPDPEPMEETAPAPSVLALLRSPKLMRLYAVGVLHVSALSIYDNLFAHHATGMGLSGGVAGAAIALGVFAEVCVLFAGGWLLDRLGPRALLAIAVLAGAPRWWLTGTTSSPTVLVLTQALHGLTFGCWWVGGIAYVLRAAPPRLRSTAQAAFVASGFGLGNLAALSIASWALPTFGSKSLFLGLTGVSVAAALALPWALGRRSQEL